MLLTKNQTKMKATDSQKFMSATGAHYVIVGINRANS